MKGKQLERNAVFWVYLRTRNRWYNFDQMNNLECGVSCILDSEQDKVKEFIVSWQASG
jgi:hypothetical protein